MTPDEVGQRLAAILGDTGVSVSASDGGAFSRATVDVPPSLWVDAVRAARDDAQLDCNYLDFLSGVDELPEGFTIVIHLWSVAARHSVLLRTRLPRDAPVVDTLTGVFPGVSWYEREVAEMFGVDFAGHPHLIPLLLPPEFEGHPLRKDFVLASRVAKVWPGAKEPGESHAGGEKRGRMRPPGVPDPQEWGPTARRTESPEE